MSSRPLRSALFVPGDSPRKIERSWGSGADALIFDLEDSVHAGAKTEARKGVAQALAQPTNVIRIVRVNSLRSGLFEADLGAIVAHPPDIVMLPKCESRDDLESASKELKKRGVDDRWAKLLPVATETARAVRNLMRSDWSHPRLIGLTWGAEDISADIGALANRENGNYTGVFTLARELCLLAAREASALAIDTAFMDVRDGTALRAEATASFRAGFDGKIAIHPAQVPIINDAFRPSDEQMAWAKSVVDLLRGNQDGVAVLNGQMIDMPHLKKAERLLRLGEIQGG